MEEKLPYTNAEKLKAAYALNLCTVSVSQIIDYADLLILEQEYETILNNLNLKEMPKDDALLKILSQLLDTITFFRIQDGDKKFIEREYQQRMKNAIWSAVPSLSVFASGDPLTIALSLASQIGTGYMNYRKEKAKAQLEADKQRWQLQRSALEQFNALQRELFDTAWRLADTYDFPDAYRLTERQIKKYNEILMDPVPTRRYDRLAVIQDQFDAYPPFWYQFGSTANSIYRRYLDARKDVVAESPFSKDELEVFKARALEHFTKYDELTKQFDLLREDQIASACALEHAELLDTRRDKERIKELIGTAVAKSGNAGDILQICAFDYLQIEETVEAAKILRRLVNDGYNEITNAQLVSRLYIADSSTEAKHNYDTLSILPELNGYLYQWPMRNSEKGQDELQREFELAQRDILLSKYEHVTSQLQKQFIQRIRRMIPVEGELSFADYMNLNGNKQKAAQTKLIRGINAYRYSELAVDMSALLDETYAAIQQLPALNSEDLGEIHLILAEMVMYPCAQHDSEASASDSDNTETTVKPDILVLQEEIANGTFTENHLKQLKHMTSNYYWNGFFENVQKRAEVRVKEITGKTVIGEYSILENKLITFCQKYDIPEPEILTERDDASTSTEEENTGWFTGIEKLQAQVERDKTIRTFLQKRKYEISRKDSKVKLWLEEDSEFNQYFDQPYFAHKHDQIRPITYAIFEDQSKKSYDLLLTKSGLIPVNSRPHMEKSVAYSKYEHDRKKNILRIGPVRYSNKDVKLSALVDVLKWLADNLDSQSSDKKKKGTPLDIAKAVGNAAGEGLKAYGRGIKKVGSIAGDVIEQTGKQLAKPSESKSHRGSGKKTHKGKTQSPKPNVTDAIVADDSSDQPKK